MFSFCTDPSTLNDWLWTACYLTTGVHMSFYLSFLKVLLLLAVTAPVALAFGFGGAMMARARFAPLSWVGKGYIALVRGVPDIAFFLFFVIALDQGIEYLRHKVLCPDWDMPIRQGSDFVVCQEAKMPLGNAAQWVHETYGFGLAVFTFAIVFGAFAANVLFGAMRAVPKAQLETAEAYGMTHAQAFEVMLTVHKKGVAVVGVFSHEIAETKVGQVMDFARRHQHPLQCTMEKE